MSYHFVKYHVCYDTGIGQAEAVATVVEEVRPSPLMRVIARMASDAFVDAVVDGCRELEVPK